MKTITQEQLTKLRLNFMGRDSKIFDLRPGQCVFKYTHTYVAGEDDIRKTGHTWHRQTSLFRKENHENVG